PSGPAEGGADRVAERGEFRRAVDPDVRNAERRQPVQLARQPRPIAERRIRAEPRRVPHVGTGIMIAAGADMEAGAVAADEIRMRSSGAGPSKSGTCQQ